MLYTSNQEINVSLVEKDRGLVSPLLDIKEVLQLPFKVRKLLVQATICSVLYFQKEMSIGCLYKLPHQQA